MNYYFFNSNSRSHKKKPEIIDCPNNAEAFRICCLKNYMDKRANWSVYDPNGCRVFGVYQNNESKRFEGVCK